MVLGIISLLLSFHGAEITYGVYKLEPLNVCTRSRVFVVENLENPGQQQRG